MFLLTFTQKSEGAIPIEEFKISKELDNLKIGSKIDVYLEKIEKKKGKLLLVEKKQEEWVLGKKWKKLLRPKRS